MVMVMKKLKESGSEKLLIPDKLSIQLKKLGLGDFFGLVRMIHNPKVSRRLSYKVPGSILKALAEIFVRKNSYKFSIVYNGNMIGVVVLENPNEDKTVYEVGYFVDVKYWGRGVATEAVKKIVKVGVEELGIKKIIGYADVSNPASGRVFEKVDFVRKKIDKGYVYWELEGIVK